MGLNRFSTSLLLLILAAPLAASAGSVQIPLQNVGAPAIDLVHEGKVLDRDEAIDLREQGVDLSRLEPSLSDVWAGKELPITDEEKWNYPADGGTVDYDSQMSVKDGGRFRVLDSSGQAFSLMVSFDLHAALIRNALMRKLGYSIPSPKYYRSLTLRFSDPAARDDFAGKLNVTMRAAASRWISKAEKGSPLLTFQDVSLEPAQVDVQQLHWGSILAKHLDGRRAMRALIIPLVLGDIGESVNRYSWELGKVLDNNVVLYGNSAQEFAEMTIDDARWVARKIAALSRADLQATVARSFLPAEVAALVVEKLVARRNHMIELFGLKDELSKNAQAYPVNTKLNIGAVKNGRLTKGDKDGDYPGYASRFKFDDPKSPLRREELLRYLETEGIALGMEKLTGMVNKYLVAQDTGDLSDKHREKVLEDMKKHYQENPNEPYVRPLGAWGGPMGSAHINASRNVVRGSYYGGESEVQLVDSIGVQASVGYFMGIEGIPKLGPSLTGNFSVQRNYIHVRPLADMKSALQVSWKDLWIPGFMKKLSTALKQDDKGVSNVAEFMEDLKVGEMLIITDTLVLNNGAHLGVPIAPLLGLSPFFGWSSMQVGGSAAHTYSILRRTTITRTLESDPKTGKATDGVQVYLQSVDQQALDLSMDFNYVVKLMKLSETRKDGDAITKAFLFPKVPDEAAEKTKWLNAMRLLVGTNESEPLEDGFGNYLLKHDMKTKIKRGSFLFWRWNNVEEAHLVKIQPPADPEGRYDPKDKERTLYSMRLSTTKGKNYYSFISDTLDSVPGILRAFPGAANFPKWVQKIPGLGFDHGGGDDNPSNSFLGNGQWTVIGTEAEITPGNESEPVSTIEHHWAGWSLPRAKLFKLVDQIEAKLKPLNLDIPIMRRNEYATTEKLQLYQIQATTLIYEAGLTKVRELFSQKEKLPVVYSVLVDLNGMDDMKSWCKSHSLPIGWTTEAPFETGAITSTYHEKEDGKTITLMCVKPWMRDVLALRRKPPTDLPKKIRWTSSLLKILDGNSDQTKLLDFIGKENFFFQFQITGFRVNGENDKDVAPTYVSDSIGTLPDKQAQGIFQYFASKYKIMAHELYAKYLSEGY